MTRSAFRQPQILTLMRLCAKTTAQSRRRTTVPASPRRRDRALRTPDARCDMPHACGHAAVDRDLHECLAHFLRGHAVIESAVDMNSEFIAAIQRAQHAQIEQAAIASAEAGTSPHRTPAILGHQIGERFGKSAGGRRFSVDIIGTEHFASNGAAGFESLAGRFGRCLVGRHARHELSPVRDTGGHTGRPNRASPRVLTQAVDRQRVAIISGTTGYRARILLDLRDAADGHGSRSRNAEDRRHLP